MTIGELITQLEKYDPNFEGVHLEDESITKDNYNNQILIIE